MHGQQRQMGAQVQTGTGQHAGEKWKRTKSMEEYGPSDAPHGVVSGSDDVLDVRNNYRLNVEIVERQGGRKVQWQDK